MDEIQKVLIEVGRKDLAQQYFNKVAVNKRFFEALQDFVAKGDLLNSLSKQLKEDDIKDKKVWIKDAIETAKKFIRIYDKLEKTAIYQPTGELKTLMNFEIMKWANRIDSAKEMLIDELQKGVNDDNINRVTKFARNLKTYMDKLQPDFDKVNKLLKKFI